MIGEHSIIDLLLHASLIVQFVLLLLVARRSRRGRSS